MGKERLGQDLVGNAGSKSREVNRISFSSGQCTFKSRVGFRGYRVPFERMVQVNEESIKNGGHKVSFFSFGSVIEVQVESIKKMGIRGVVFFLGGWSRSR